MAAGGWWVQVQVRDLSSPYSWDAYWNAWYIFTATSGAPGIVSGFVPNGIPGQSLTPTLSWNVPTGAVGGSTTYTVPLWAAGSPPNGHLLAALPATTQTSTVVPASEQLMPGDQVYYWNVNACTGSASSGFNPTWPSFKAAVQPPATASNALPGYIPNSDFSGGQGTSVIPSWTGTSLTANGSYVPGVQSLQSSPFGLDYPSGGGKAYFRAGYRLPSGNRLGVSFNGVSVLAVSTGTGTPANTWVESSFAIGAGAGPSGSMTLTGGSPAPDVAHVERLDAPSGRGTHRRWHPLPRSAGPEVEQFLGLPAPGPSG
ncbi:MAG: hypothetical protein ACR2PL_24050 [Dehalococcoidia bacterium]